MNTTQKNQKGFTIIEVVLVLAIAALIFLVVFLALPALQRSQRDTQRKNDASRFATQLISYSSNNNGKVPEAANIASFVTKYLKVDNDGFSDPKTGEDYVVAVGDSDPSKDPGVGAIWYYERKVCDGETVKDGGSRNAAIRMKLEGSGVYCQSK